MINIIEYLLIHIVHYFNNNNVNNTIQYNITIIYNNIIQFNLFCDNC